MTVSQIKFPMLQLIDVAEASTTYRDRFLTLLKSNLDFSGKDSAYASHNYHAFPAKFPPQLPRAFIEGLTKPGDVVLDPMMGSGTTIVEAYLADRNGIGLDIDPLALRLCKTKTTPLPVDVAATVGNMVLKGAEDDLRLRESSLRRELATRYKDTERKFIDYWFSPTAQIELLALVRQLDHIDDLKIRGFLEVVFSGIIITKSGGVSLARDLAHTRPHKVTDKAQRSAIADFRKRLRKNLDSLAELTLQSATISLYRGNAQRMPFQSGIADLIVTSPPYASNAIDYMRAHKFSLVWLGYSMESLSELRSDYIGHDAVAGLTLLSLPEFGAQVVDSVARVDAKKAKVLHRYYSEMTLCLAEIARILKPGKAAVIVVGSSNMRGIDTQTDVCLGEIGKKAGLELVHIGTRAIDRDKRMMPARKNAAQRSQIEERMHDEYVIGFYKP
jgi:DNA modification methylase